MGLLDFFRPVQSWSAKQLRAFLAEQSPDDLTLLDVRQPAEYAAGHLPGALLIPVTELQTRLPQLDKGHTIITYCASGVRSRAAAAVLHNAGFPEVYNLSGGIQAWQGEVAQGVPEADLGCFARARTPEEHVALAWYLEAGTQQFYQHLAGERSEPEAVRLFEALAGAEEHHKQTLAALYEGFSGRPLPPDFPAGVIRPPQEHRMEGGMAVAEAIAWSAGRRLCEVLELAMAVETNALDRYLLLRRELPDEQSRRAFEILSDEERRHLETLASSLEKSL